MDTTRIDSRVRGRGVATDLASLIEFELQCDRHAMDALAEYFEQFRIREDTRKIVELTMTQLAAERIPFGIHAGKRFDEIPVEYLDWLCGEQEGFYQKLRAYLKWIT